LADEIGIKNVAKYLMDLYLMYEEDRYRTSVLLKQLVVSNKAFY